MEDLRILPFISSKKEVMVWGSKRPNGQRFMMAHMPKYLNFLRPSFQKRAAQ